MYKLTLYNDNGESLEFNKIGGAFTIKEITGLNPPNATINMNTTAILDGARYNSAKLQTRSINIAFAIEYDAAVNRLEIYKVLQTKKHVTLRYESETLDVVTDGYVEKLEISYFDIKQICTVSILCPSPYLRSYSETMDKVSNLADAFHFEFASTESPQLVMGSIVNVSHVTIANNGTVNTGLIIEVTANGNASNFKLYNYLTNEYIGINYALQSGDVMTIDTTPGNKTVKLRRDGSTTNIFNYVASGSKWLQLEPGETEFVYTADNAVNIDVKIKHYDMYEGV